MVQKAKYFSMGETQMNLVRVL